MARIKFLLSCMWTLTPGTEAGRRGDAVGVEQGHNLNRPKDGSGPDAAAPASRRATRRGAGWPPRHRRNRWDKSGRRGAAPAICSADRYVWVKRKGRAAAFSSHPTSGRRTRQRPGAPKGDALPRTATARSRSARRAFSIQSHASAARPRRAIRRSSGRNSAVTRERSSASPPVCLFATATRSA